MFMYSMGVDPCLYVDDILLYTNCENTLDIFSKAMSATHLYLHDMVANLAAYGADVQNECTAEGAEMCFGGQCPILICGRIIHSQRPGAWLSKVLRG